MDCTEEALSDVHVGQSSTIIPTDNKCKDYNLYLTRFYFNIKDSCGVSTSISNAVSDTLLTAVPYHVNQNSGAVGTAAKDFNYDEDGDLILPRQTTTTEYQVITLEHTLQTRLIDVGMQVWQGCLLLCDYIIHNSDNFRSQVVLELGGGIGLASIVMGTLAKQVICTDVGDEMLAICSGNIKRNSHLFRGISTIDQSHDVVLVKSLDWGLGIPCNDNNGNEFCWNSKDLDLLSSATYIMAADVIYDDQLTDSFLSLIIHLLRLCPSAVVILSIEKRLNFTLTELEVTCPAYNHFQKCLHDLCSEEVKSHFQVAMKQLDTNFPMYMKYNRCDYVELWEIKMVPC